MPTHYSGNFEETVVETASTTPTLMERMPTGVKAVVAAATLAVASGCSVNPPRTQSESLVRVNPHGHMKPSAAEYPAYRENQAVDPQTSRTLGGGAIGFLVCRILGATPAGSLGCGIVGGVIGHETYNQAEVTQREYDDLQKQMAEAYRGNTSVTNRRYSNLTRYVGVSQSGKIGKTYQVRFKIQEIATSGRLTNVYYVQAIVKSGTSHGGQALEIVPPSLFPGETSMPTR